MSRTSSRKEEHVRLCIGENVTFRRKTNGFGSWEFEHVALPELNVEDIDTGISFLGRRIAFPLLITGMTGGYAGAGRINAGIAEVCAGFPLAMGVGSQRQTLEDERHLRSYTVARKRAPRIPIVANLGAAEVATLKSPDAVLRLVEMIEADAFAVHLNPLQEFLQPDGTPRFAGVLGNIAMLARKLPVPVIVKEVGAGISAAVARRLFDAGVRWIDVAGAGGTSWAGVEILRRGRALPVSPSFWDWGIRTADALVAIRRMKPRGAKLIASGGIEDGIMIAKALALGAELAGSARPILQALDRGGEKELERLLLGWQNDLRGAMFLTGSRTIAQLKRKKMTPAA